jgi:hypothetical protein
MGHQQAEKPLPKSVTVCLKGGNLWGEDIGLIVLCVSGLL